MRTRFSTMRTEFNRILCSKPRMLALLAITLHAPLAAQEYNFGGGNGTPDDPYQITSTNQLDSIRDYTTSGGSNYLNDHFVLMNDLDFASYNYADGNKADEGKGWLPIGHGTYGGENVLGIFFIGVPFSGTFNGKGHTIHNLYIHRPDEDYIGLFGSLDRGGATIDSLGLVDAEVTGNNNVGTMVGWGGIITHSYALGCQVAGDNRVGGLMGAGGGLGSVIRYSHATGGQVTGIGTEESSDGVFGDSGTGGLMGHGTQSRLSPYIPDTIEYSYASNLCDGGNGFAGGLAGQYDGILRYSHASGQVVGNHALGGIVAFLAGTLEHSYSTALVIGNGAGGLVDTNEGTIRGSYACGKVEGSGSKYGLVQDSEDGVVHNSYWNTETSGIAAEDGEGGTGLTTEQMYDATNFTGFDFTDVWLPPTDGEHFPQLREVDKNAQVLLFAPVDAKAPDATPFSLTVESLPPTLSGITPLFESSNTEVATVDGSSGEVTIVSTGTTTLTVSREGNDDYAPVQQVRRLVVHDFPGGTGTEDDPYQIATREQLDFIRNHGLGANLLDDHYALTTDLDFSGYAYGGDERGWQPIGNLSNGFTGSFNGKGHVIANLKVNRPNEDNVGLFGLAADSSKIDSLGLENVHIIGDRRVGGMVGYMFSDDTISNSYAVGRVLGAEDVGGLVGFCPSDAYVHSSYAVAEVEGSNNVGNLVGRNWTGIIENCYAAGRVIGNRVVGGLVGRNFRGIIENCYAVGRILGTTRVGGLVGDNDRGTVTNSYWNTETSNQPNSDGGTGRTTAQMYDTDAMDDDGMDYEDYFVGFGFYDETTAPNNVWLPPTEDEHFPQLRGVSKNGQVMLLPLLESTNDIDGTLSVAPTFILPPILMDREGNEIDTMYVSSNSNVASVVEDGDGTVTIKAVGVTSLTVSRAGNANYAPVSFLSTLLVHPFPSGTGTEDNPYQVAMPEHLNAIRDYGGGINLLDDHYALIADLDFKDYTYTDQNKGWLPIGHGVYSLNLRDFFGTSFTGVFNGRGNVIRHVKINRREEDYVGLFGSLAGSGKIDSLGLEDADIIGKDYVGGLVGEMTGKSKVKNSYASGQIVGNALREGRNIGGLVGRHNGDSISSSYAACWVAGTDDVGGLVGRNSGSIIADSYATGWVMANGLMDYDPDVGGLVGSHFVTSVTENSYSTAQVFGNGINHGGLVGNNDGSTRDSYWNTEISNQASSDGGTGRTTEHMYEKDSFDGFDFDKIWLSPVENERFPQLRNVSKNAQILTFNPLESIGKGNTFSLKEGNEEDDDYFLLPPTLTENDDATEVPVQIESANTSVVTVGENNEMTAENFGTTTLTLRRAGNEDYIPVSFSRDLLVHPFSTGSGTAEDPFKVSEPGHLDFIRSGGEINFLASHYEMTANLDFSNYEYSDTEGWKPITPFNGVFNGKGHVVSGLQAIRRDADNIGLFGVIGTQGRIDSLGVEDVIMIGRNSVGAIAGRNQGIISHSYADGSIQGNDNLGGMVGVNDSTIQYSYASARVEGEDNVGGLAGVNGDTIQYSYAYGGISGTSMTGGLVGMDDAGVYRSSYWNTDISGQASSAGGGTGLTNEQMYTTAGFADFDFAAETGAWMAPSDGVHFPLLRGVNGQQWVTLTTTDPTTITEGDSVEFKVERGGLLSENLAVSVGIAQESEFVLGATSRIIEFTGGATTAMFKVKTEDDNSDEADGRVTVSLLDSLGYEVGSSTNRGSSIGIDVMDNDIPAISIASDGDITEGDNAVFTLTRSSGSGTLSINVSVTEEGSSYISGAAPTMVSLGDGLRTVKLEVPTEDDEVDESNGLIIATLEASAGNYDLGDPSSARVAVEDDDGVQDPDVSIASAGDVDEGEAAVFTLTRTTTSGELDVTVSVTGSYLSGMAPTMASFADGEAMATLAVPTEENDIDEEDGSITATLTSGIGYSVVEPSSATVAVSDNDLPNVSIASAGDINEGEDAVFTLTRSSSSGALTVDVSVTEQGSSYISGTAPTMVDFTDGSTTATLSVPTEDDNIDESNGLITATLGASGNYDLGDPSSATVAVSDNDGADDPDVSIASAGDVMEGEDAVFTLTRTTASSDLDVNVLVTEQGGYISGTAPTMVSFASGETMATLTVPTEDNNTKEADGSITATVTSGVGYTIGDPSSATVAVADNDDEMMVADPEVSIASAGDVTEGADAVFTLTRSSASSALTVNVSVTEQGSYISGTAPTMVDFAANATTATLTINTDDDDVDEEDGSITATVSSGMDYTVGDPSSATAAVADNDDPEPVGLSDESEVVLYPNPVERYLHVRLHAGGSVSIYTLSGRLEEAYRIQAGREQVSLDVSGLSSGIYVVTLSDIGGQTTHYRIVKE